MPDMGLGPDVDVTPDDIALGWRPMTEQDKEAAEALIERAAPILLSQSPGLLDRLAAGTVPPEAVEQAIIQAVRRALLPALANPEGAKRFARSGDDYSESFEWDTAALAAELYFTTRELGSLTARGRSRGKAFTINTLPGV